MIEGFRPMLAEDCDNIETVSFPVLATPKVDGIRCLTFPPPKNSGESQTCTALSRKLKSIPNIFVRTWLETNCGPWLDGELVVVDELCNVLPFFKTSSGIMGQKGEPNFRFLAFDHFENISAPYVTRIVRLGTAYTHLGSHRLQKLIPVHIHDIEELETFERACLAAGHEGVMIRSMDGVYKKGRSTLREGFLLKIKRWRDSEAEVLSVFEEKTNTNEAKKNELGLTKRSSAKAGKIGSGTLGGFHVRDLETGVTFNCIGGDHATRAQLWVNRDSLPGKIIKYKYLPAGTKEKPRHPQWLGFRDPIDMGTPEEDAQTRKDVECGKRDPWSSEALQSLRRTRKPQVSHAD